jgi:hypothetical protein
VSPSVTQAEVSLDAVAPNSVAERGNVGMIKALAAIRLAESLGASPSGSARPEARNRQRVRHVALLRIEDKLRVRPDLPQSSQSSQVA